MIVDKNINPKNSLYYLGSQVIKILNNSSDKVFDFLYIYEKLKKNKHDISVGLYILVLDWLFILGVIKQGTGKSILKCF